MWEDEVFDRAAALSYYMLFALFPMLLFLTALLGMLPFHLMQTMMAYLATVAPTDVVQRTLAEISRGASGGLLSIGVAGTLWSASNGMAALMTALNVAYDVTERRSWWRRRLTALGLTIGVALFIPAVLVLLLSGERLGYRIAEWIGMGSAFAQGWVLARWPLLALIAALATAGVYQFAPARRLRWRRWGVTPGAVFAVGAWLAVSLGLRAYIHHLANYNATYGSIGGVIVLLLWLYLSGVALLVGAEIDAELEQPSRDGAVPVERPRTGVG
jgi:membrane protein